MRVGQQDLRAVPGCTEYREQRRMDQRIRNIMLPAGLGGPFRVSLSGPRRRQDCHIASVTASWCGCSQRFRVSAAGPAARARRAPRPAHEWTLPSIRWRLRPRTRELVWRLPHTGRCELLRVRSCGSFRRPAISRPAEQRTAPFALRMRDHSTAIPQRNRATLNPLARLESLDPATSPLATEHNRAIAWTAPTGRLNMTHPVIEMPEHDTDDGGTAARACACGHPLDRHDPVARRFCDATIASALTRSCICRPQPA